MASFDGVVLCGGASSRMGADKAFEDLDGSPLVQRPIEALANASRRVAVGGDQERLSRLGVEYLADPSSGVGPAFAVHAAARYLTEHAGGHPTMIALSCDLPFIDQAGVAALVRAQQGSGADLVVPLRSGRPQWLIGAWSRRRLAHLSVDPSMSMRSIIGHLSVLYLVEPQLEHCWFDADTPAELKFAQSVLNPANAVQSKQ